MTQKHALLATVITVAACATVAPAQDNTKPGAEGRRAMTKTTGNKTALKGTLKLCEFTGPITKQKVQFKLYLPPGYEGGTKRYPVMVDLHGKRGAHVDIMDRFRTQVALSEARLQERLLAEGLITQPYIIVGPNGYRTSMWTDSFDGREPVETNIIREIIPYLDAHYRTIPTREKRIVLGFSMGGYGAFYLSAKYPDVFSLAVVVDGALHNFQTIEKKYKNSIFPEVYNGDSDYYDAHSPWAFLRKNADAIRKNVEYVVLVGRIVDRNRALKKELATLKIPFVYDETGFGHERGRIEKSRRKQIAAAIEKRFSN